MSATRLTRSTELLRGWLPALLLALGLAVVACQASENTAAENTAAEDVDAEAVDWEPEGDVTMVVPFGPGGGSDILGRATAAGLEEVRPGITIAVENRSGGSGAVGYAYLLEQEGDPHFLLPTEPSGVLLPLQEDVPFTWESFTPLAQIADDVLLLAVHTDSPYETLDDWVAAAREQPLTVGIPGRGGVDDVLLSLFEQEAGITMDRVVYDGSGEQVAGLLGGDTEGTTLNPGEFQGQIEAGDFRALAVFAEERYENPPFDAVPTMFELGYETTLGQYRGVFAAGGIAEEQRAYWEQVVLDWTETDSYQEYLSTNEVVPTIRASAEFGDFLGEYEANIRPILEEAQ